MNLREGNGPFRRARARLVALVSVAAITTAGVVTLTPLAASAGTSTLTVPRAVYTGINQTVDFTGTDPVSNEARGISMDASVSGSCNPTAGNGYDVNLCGRVQLTLNDSYGGTLNLDGTTKVQSSPNVWKTASGAIIDGDNPTTAAERGGPVLGISMNGTLDQLNGALADLQYIPATDYEDRTYNEQSPPGAGTPTLHILVNDGSASPTNASADITLRVEGTNGGPTVAVPVAPVLAPAGADTALPPDTSDPAMISVIDPELCLGANNVCDGAYPDGPPIAEPNDAMLLAMWIPEADCGTFDLRSTSGFVNFGGALLPSINDILTAPTALGLQQDAADAILTNLGTTPAGLDLTAQGSGPYTVFAATAGSLADVRYALSQLTYHAPADDAVCHVNIAFSDLGNNGMPQEWIPADGGSVPEHEIPKPLSDTQSITFNVKDSHPDVTIDQVTPNTLGDPAGPNKPAVFRVSFADEIDPTSFDVSDLSLSTSSATGAAFGLLTPVTPGLEYTVAATATGDGKITLTMDFTAYSAGHEGEAAYANDAPVYDDNEITWDQTAPTATITKAAGQADPTTTGPVKFLVETDETFSSAPASFDGSDIVLDATTATLGSPTVTWLGLAHPSQFEVSVPVSGAAGDVTASVKAGAFVDSALNTSAASSTATVAYDPAFVDITNPTVTIEQGPSQDDPTNTSPIIFEVKFSEPVTDFATGDVTLSGTADPTSAVVSGSGDTYTVEVAGMAGSGTVIASIAGRRPRRGRQPERGVDLHRQHRRVLHGSDRHHQPHGDDRPGRRAGRPDLGCLDHLRRAVLRDGHRLRHR
ncbi:MAG: hypothetical protein U0W40_05230 [Acidimicrobiia bacterium]